MILLAGVVFIASLSAVSGDCEITNGTLTEGQVVFDTGCYRTTCTNGKIVKEKVCPEDYTLIRFGGTRTSCVKLIKKRMDWNSAWAACAKLSVGEEDVGNAKLVEAPNKYEYAKVWSYSQMYSDTVGNTTDPEVATESSLLREINSEEEEDMLDRWEINRQMRDAHAATSPCGVEMSCESGDECATGFFCDGTPTCSDKSDEYYCGGNVEYWMAANNERNENVVTWVTSNLKVKDAPVPQRNGLCLAVVFGEKSLYDCDFEGLYPLCEVCSSNSKVDNGCEYDGKLKNDGEEVDRQSCGKLFCRRGEIEEEFSCAPGYKHIEWDGGKGCYLYLDGLYTYKEAQQKCHEAVGMKKLASISNEKEGEAVAHYLFDVEAQLKRVWVHDPNTPEDCVTIKEGLMTSQDDCNITARALCESCYSESEQADGKSEFTGCTYLSIDFEKGDQIEIDEKSCTSTVCQGKGEWEREYFGDGCCEVNRTLVRPGQTEDSKLVADESGAQCREVNCKNGEFIDKDIPCGCKGENGDIYPDQHIILKDVKTCQETYCDAGTIKTRPYNCQKCLYGRTTINPGARRCFWLRRRRIYRCVYVTCSTSGIRNVYPIRSFWINACTRYRNYGCR